VGRILGAHIVGPHADEVINLFALAIRHDLTVDDLKSTMLPTQPELPIRLHALGNAYDPGLHHHLPALRHCEVRNHADRCLPVLL